MTDKVLPFPLKSVNGHEVVHTGEISGWVCDCGSQFFLLLEGGHIQCGRCFGNHAMQWFMPGPAGEAA